MTIKRREDFLRVDFNEIIIPEVLFSAIKLASSLIVGPSETFRETSWFN